MTIEHEPLTPYQRADEARLSVCFGRAFGDDPLFEYILAGKHDRLPETTWCMRQAIRLVAKHRHGYVLGDPPIAGAFWIPPGDPPIPSLLTQIAAGNWEAVYRCGFAATKRILRREADLEERYRAHLSSPCWILDLVAVDPEEQGKGLAARLLAPMLARFDAERQSTYLVTYNPKNVGLYRRFGFDVVLEAAFADGPVGWSMRRAPGGHT